MRACSVTGGVLIAVVSLTAAPFKSHDLTYNVKIGIRTFSGEKNELRSAAESGKPTPNSFRDVSTKEGLEKAKNRVPGEQIGMTKNDG